MSSSSSRKTFRCRKHIMGRRSRFEREFIDLFGDEKIDIEDLELRFVPPENAPEKEQSAAEFLPQNAEELTALYENDNELVKYPHAQVIRDLIPRQFHVTKHSYGLTDVFAMLRRYHVPYTLHASENTVLDFEEGEETGGGVFLDLWSGVVEFEWKGDRFFGACLCIDPKRASDHDSRISLLCAASIDSLRRLKNDIDLFEPSTEGRILVYRDGWNYSAKIKHEISHLTWDNLVLPEEMKKDIRENTERFFADGGSVYKKLGIPYKRGFLLVGEPGSGKSLTAKIIANTLDVTFIYVLSLAGRYRGGNEGINEVFRKARLCAPCVVCFEDLDSQLTESYRTEFLNAMDGFETNDGVLTIGTTNHPENIDPALLNRPSRFDRKWVYPNPEEAQREIYLIDRMKRLLETQDLEKAVEKTVKKVAKGAKKYSYAMLQELVVTAGCDHFLNGTDINEALVRAAEITAEQIKLGTADKLTDQMNEDDDQLGFRMRD